MLRGLLFLALYAVARADTVLTLLVIWCVQFTTNFSEFNFRERVDFKGRH